MSTDLKEFKQELYVWSNADTLQQWDLATGGSKPNGNRLGGKGDKPVSPQLSFVPFFFFLVYSWKQSIPVIEHQGPVLFVWMSWAQVKNKAFNPTEIRK